MQRTKTTWFQRVDCALYVRHMVGVLEDLSSVATNEYRTDRDFLIAEKRTKPDQCQSHFVSSHENAWLPIP